jgi:hypothetical protein
MTTLETNSGAVAVRCVVDKSKLEGRSAALAAENGIKAVVNEVMVARKRDVIVLNCLDRGMRGPR